MWFLGLGKSHKEKVYDTMSGKNVGSTKKVIYMVYNFNTVKEKL